MALEFCAGKSRFKERRTNFMGLTDGIFGKLNDATRGLQATGQQLDWLLQGFVGTEADSIKTENSIGVEVATDFFQTFPEVTDPAYANYLADMHRWLVENGAYKLDPKFANTERQWHRHVVEADELLAAGLPGGYIVLSKSLVDFTKQDQDEVAFLLAHETSHILLSHARKRVQKEFMVRVGTRVVPVAGVGATLLRGMAGGIARGLIDKAYGQENEYEADRLAVQMTRRAGFDPRGSIRHLERIRGAFPNASTFPPYYAQHPAIDARANNIERALAQ